MQLEEFEKNKFRFEQEIELGSPVTNGRAMKRKLNLFSRQKLRLYKTDRDDNIEIEPLKTPLTNDGDDTDSLIESDITDDEMTCGCSIICTHSKSEKKKPGSSKDLTQTTVSSISAEKVEEEKEQSKQEEKEVKTVQVELS